MRPYGISPRSIRIRELTGKGYVEAEMAEVFQRYISRAEVDALKAELAERTVRKEE